MTKTEFGDADVKEARFLARQVGVADEPIDLLLVQTGDIESHGEGPRTLLVSAGEGTLDLFLTHWLGENHAEMLRHAAAKPVVIWTEPESIAKRPGLSGWSALRDELFDKRRGHIAVLYYPHGELPSRLAGEIASASGWDSVIVVTRAGMPLPQSERDLVRSLSKLVAVCKVLAIAIPGEIPNKAEADKVEQYARSRVESNGFDKGRCAGVWFWWLDGERRHSQAITDPGELLVRDAQAAAKGREIMFLTGMLSFLKKVGEKAKSDGVKPQPKLTDDDLREMEQNLHKALTGLHRSVAGEFATDIRATDTKLRDYAIDQVVGWNRSEDFNGVWLSYVEAVRPGVKAGLAEKIRQAARVLSIDPATPPKTKPGDVTEPVATRPRHPANPFKRLLREPLKRLVTDFLIRLGSAIVCGIALWAFTPQQPLGGMLAAGAGAVGALAGFAIGRPLAVVLRKVFATDQTSPAIPKPPLTAPPDDPIEGKVRNFALFEHEITTWFLQHIRADRVDVASRCRVLIEKLEALD